MTLSKRLYWIAGLVAIMALAVAAVTMVSGNSSAQTNSPTSAATTVPAAAGTDTVVPCSDSTGANSGTEPTGSTETDNVQEQCGDQNQVADTGTDTTVPCSDPTGANSDNEATGGADTDNVQEQCGDQNGADGSD
jgi:hypothetical protein